MALRTPPSPSSAGSRRRRRSATAAAPGSITIGGITFPIAAGTTATGTGILAVGSNFCLVLGLNGSGQITAVSVTPSPTATVTITAPYTSYTPPTATTAGSITIGGVTFTIAAGTTLTTTQGTPLAAVIVRQGVPSHFEHVA